MTAKSSITVFVPAFNEEENLQRAVKGVLEALIKVNPPDYEIIILNAFSSDGTGEIADNLSEEYKKIKVIHRKSWYGLGANYMEGVRQASMSYFVLFPGDNENSTDSLAKSLEYIGKADIIVSYTLNTQVRSLHRRIVSRFFVYLLNFLFNLKLKYYNGNAVYKTDMLKKVSVRSEDFAYNAEILIKLIKSGQSFIEVGIEIKPTGKTAIFNIRNVFGVIKSIMLLFIDVTIINRGKYKKTIKQIV